MKTNLKLKNLKGWFWFAPIYWDDETKELSPRFPFLLNIALWLHHSMLFLAAFLQVDIEENYPIKITDIRCKEESK